ncbi:MAG: hypothetical protein ACLFWL_03115 [Candidatus Brocadiia bacterium]
MDKIDSIRSKAQTRALLWGYMAAFVVAVGFVFVGVVLDHWLVLQSWGRTAFFWSFLTLCALGTVLATVFPLVSRMSRLFVARRIESEFPDLKNSLISYLQCRGDKRLPSEIRRLLREKAYSRVKSVDEEMLSEPPLSRFVPWLMIACVILFGIYGVASPKSVPVSLKRLFKPMASILPPTRTRVTSVQPGDVWLLKGDRISVRAHIKGQKPDHAAVIWIGPDGAEKRFLLSKSTDEVWTGVFPNMLEDSSYYVIAGDTRSAQYSITTLPRPAVTGVNISLVPPDYTELPERSLEEGNFETVAGAQVNLTARTNLPPAGGKITFGSGEGVPMVTTEDERVLRTDFTVRQSDTYRIFFKTSEYPDGSVFENDSPLTYHITCRNDRAPVVRILAPDNGVQKQSDSRVAVVYGAKDDYEVTSLWLFYEVQGGQTDVARIPLEETGPKIDGQYEWDLSELSLNPPVLIRYRLEARDNFPDSPQVGISDKRTIQVGQFEEQELTQAGEEGRPDGEQESEKGTEDEKSPGETKDQEKGAEGEAGEGEEKKNGENEKLGGEREGEEKTGAEGDQMDREAREKRAREIAEAAEKARPRGEKAELGREQQVADASGSEPSEEGKGDQKGDGACCKGGEKSSPVSKNGEQSGKESRGRAKQQQKPGEAEKGRKKSGKAGESCRKGGSGSAGQQGGDSGGESSGKGQGAQGENSGKSGSQSGSQAGTGKDGGQSAGSTGGSGSSEGEGSRVTANAGGSGGGGTGGAPTGGEPARKGALPPSEIDEKLRNLRRQIEEEGAPKDMLRELGMNERQLKKFLDNYLAKSPRREEETEKVSGAAEKREGRVLKAGGKRDKDVAITDTAPKSDEKDDLRSRFEDAEGRLSPRYREAVDAYYKKLSGSQ